MELTEKHIKKLAVITDFSLEEVEKLSSMGLINVKRAVDLLIKFDWKMLAKRAPQFPAAQRATAIAAEYDLSVEHVLRFVRSKRIAYSYCKACGKVLTPREYTRNHGFCNGCVQRHLLGELNDIDYLNKETK